MSPVKEAVNATLTVMDVWFCVVTELHRKKRRHNIPQLLRAALVDRDRWRHVGQG
jgi:hypothetical protein